MKTFSTTALITLVAALMSAGISPVAAGCYPAGHWFNEKNDPKHHARRACEGYDGNRGALQGTFAPGETKSACVESNWGHYVISVKNLNTRDAIDLADGDCTHRLWEVVDKCAFGGELDVAGWRFR
jgi:hypothetical protein